MQVEKYTGQEGRQEDYPFLIGIEERERFSPLSWTCAADTVAISQWMA